MFKKIIISQIFFCNHIKLQIYDFLRNCFETKIYYLFNPYANNLKFTLLEIYKLTIPN